MQLYNVMISPFAARCRMQIYAKNLPVEILDAKKDLSRERLLAANPLAKVPVLLDGDFSLPESEVICEYLEQCFPDPALRPQDATQAASVRLLSRFADLYLMAPLIPLFAHLSRRSRVQDVVDRGVAEIARGIQAVESRIGSGGYATGTALSLADCALVPIVFFLKRYLPILGVEDCLADAPRLAAWWQAMQDNPHAARVVAEMQQAADEAAGKK